MLNRDFYQLTQDFQGAIFQVGYALQTAPLPPVTDSIVYQLRRGYAESPGWLLTQAQEFDPEPLSVERFRVRAVWSSERIVAGLLDLMVGEKWLDRRGEDYWLTETGRSLIQALAERRAQILDPVQEKVSYEDCIRLEGLCRRVLDASLNSAEPPGKWSLAHSRKRDPADDQPIIYKLFQYGADFNAYRDDAHMAAFKPLNVPAYEWEAFSLIWQGGANSAEGIFDQLPHRGYSRTEYMTALSDLQERSWIEAAGDNHFQVSERGRTIREETERLTDTYFYGIWSVCLREKEADELMQLMKDMKEKLEKVGTGA